MNFEANILINPGCVDSKSMPGVAIEIYANPNIRSMIDKVVEDLKLQKQALSPPAISLAPTVASSGMHTDSECRFMSKIPLNLFMIHFRYVESNPSLTELNKPSPNNKHLLALRHVQTPTLSID